MARALPNDFGPAEQWLLLIHQLPTKPAYGRVKIWWSRGAVHVNIGASLSREKRAELFVAAIIEGPIAWKVRPVGKWFTTANSA